ncbi:hypothetical protein B0H17DRAFT_1186160 [Mycena rosella]|uniref:Uncharacterized protein n=1 Tax=Mycena rosella TaxID=1033263 RepID=A0AAD7G467_MYCRO|nr:hypothetical protein B0H17DRAFT_1186160 [Mycena rosella]
MDNLNTLPHILSLLSLNHCAVDVQLARVANEALVSRSNRQYRAKPLHHVLHLHAQADEEALDNLRLPGQLGLRAVLSAAIRSKLPLRIADAHEAAVHSLCDALNAGIGFEAPARPFPAAHFFAIAGSMVGQGKATLGGLTIWVRAELADVFDAIAAAAAIIADSIPSVQGGGVQGATQEAILAIHEHQQLFLRHLPPDDPGADEESSDSDSDSDESESEESDFKGPADSNSSTARGTKRRRYQNNKTTRRKLKRRRA